MKARDASASKKGRKREVIGLKADTRDSIPFSYSYFLFPEWIFQKDKDGRGEVEMIDFNSDTKEEEEEEVVGFQYTKL